MKVLKPGGYYGHVLVGGGTAPLSWTMFQRHRHHFSSCEQQTFCRFLDPRTSLLHQRPARGPRGGTWVRACSLSNQKLILTISDATGSISQLFPLLKSTGDPRAGTSDSLSSILDLKHKCPQVCALKSNLHAAPEGRSGVLRRRVVYEGTPRPF